MSSRPPDEVDDVEVNPHHHRSLKMDCVYYHRVVLPSSRVQLIDFVASPPGAAPVSTLLGQELARIPSGFGQTRTSNLTHSTNPGDPPEDVGRVPLPAQHTDTRARISACNGLIKSHWGGYNGVKPIDGRGGPQRQRSC